MPAIPGRILTLFFVFLAWIPFRAENMTQAKSIFKGMFLPASWNFSSLALHHYGLILAGFVIVFFCPSVAYWEKKFRPSWWNAILAVILLVSCMFLFVKTSPFIYFNF